MVYVMMAANCGEVQIAQEIRRDVFVREQGVPIDVEQDGLDDYCRHMIVFYNYAPAGCCRLRIIENSLKIERFAILQEHRGIGLGKALMNHTLKYAAAEKFSEVWLNAQLAVERYYEKLGFVGRGDTFEEAGICHRKMIYVEEMPVE